MNKEGHNSDTNEYDEESFDNESSEDVSSDEESISEEESSDGESLDELLPDNSSIKSEPDSIDKNQSFEQNSNVSSANSDDEEDAEETPDDLISNKTEFEAKNDDKTKIYTSAHEIDESESDDLLAEEELTENIKSLIIQNEESSLEVEVPIKNINLEADDADNDDDAQRSSSQQSEIEFIVTSQTPTSFNSENYALHMEITQKPTRSSTSIQQQRNSHRKSLSFSNERMREIERHNQILLRKILTQKPRKEFVNQKIQCPKLRITTSAVNRKKQQRQIDLDNQVLKRKIEAIALRRPHNL